MVPSPEAALSEVALLRLAAQRLCVPAGSAVDAVSWMTAMQGQDLRGVLRSVALRTTSKDPAEVEQALAGAQLVRGWPMRGTLHLVPAEDLPWLTGLLAPRILAGIGTRRAQLDLTEADVDRAAEIAEEALQDRQLTRSEVMQAWEFADMSTAGQRGYHLIATLAMRGLLVFGPLDGNEQRIVLTSEWIPRPRTLDRDEALAEVALRYFRSHGPATVQDLARWTGLTMKDVRSGTAAARPHLASIDVEGVEHLLDPATPDLLEQHREECEEVLLLPGFDELVLGYGDRRAVVDPEHAAALCPGGNGVFRSTVVHRGRAVGTWKRPPKPGRPVEATPFDTFEPEVVEALATATLG